ncbi:MAG: P-II family nitrogen regulator, partial [Oscillospiraceae bacterium]|nr:P-II family nitrogen regulator [Oscillospiraceae bacterium]
MELYYVISILDRDKRNRQEKIYKALGLKISMVMMGRGTATRAHLAKHGLTLTEKAVVSTVADRETVSLLFRQTKQKMYIDIPGNGIMISIPIKSVGGTSTLEQLTNQTSENSGKPDMSFEYELIYVILNEGHSDEVMDVARPAGAAGGTVISAKGTGINQTVKLKGLSLADRKEVILIVARADNKADIMRAIIENAGTQ